MRRLASLIVAAGAMAVISAAPAHASMVLQISDGNVLDTVTFNASGNLVSEVNVNVGSFQVTVTSSTTAGSNGDAALLTTTNTQVLNNGSSTGTLTITAFAPGFTLPFAPTGSTMSLAESGSITGASAGGNSASFQSWVSSPSASDLASATTLFDATVGPFSCTETGSPNSCSIGTEATTFLRNGSDFSLTNSTVMTIAGNSNLSTSLETIATVPEPGSMVLFGSGLIGLAGAVRRRLAKRA